MSFPTTVDAGLSSAEAPGIYGPFLYLGIRYEILVNNNVSPPTLIMNSSPDGISWTTVPVGSPPQMDFFANGANYTCVQSVAHPNRIYCFYPDVSDNSKFAVQYFDVNAGTWSGILASSPTPPATSADVPCVAGISPADDSIILVADGASVTLNDVSHGLPCYTKFSAGSFSAWTTLGYSDYGTITDWKQRVCGIVVDSTGNACIFTQQITRLGHGQVTTVSLAVAGSYPTYIPLDADQYVLREAYGAGGGAGPGWVGNTASSPGGGGGGYSSVAGGAAPAGTTPTAVVGAGGALTVDGGASTFPGVSAAGGGGAPDVNTPGTGHGGGGNGGARGAAGAGGGGGGGGCAGPTTGGGAGAVGHSGGLNPIGGDGGTAGGGRAGTGGGGGGGGPGSPSQDGDPGGNAGGGGGGQGWGPFETATGIGADGQVNISYTHVRSANVSRLFQQRLSAGGSLGTLTEIASGQFPQQLGGSAGFILMPFDCKISAGNVVAIVFSGCAFSAGYVNLAVGKGTMADPITFSFQSVPTLSGSSGIRSNASLAWSGTSLFCAWHASTGLSAVPTFYAKADTGSGFGSLLTIGALSAGNVGMFSRLQALVVSGKIEITWGTPQPGGGDVTTPD